MTIGQKKRKIIVNIFYSILIIVIIIPIYFAFDSDLRRSSYKRTIAFIDLYKFYSIKQHSRDIKTAAKKIEDYINFSQKITPGKNAMWQGIYDITFLISKNAKNQNDFNHLQEVYLKFLEIDPDAYMIRVWASKALSDDNQEESIKHLIKAISLSPANEEAYREMLQIFKKIEDKDLISKYCKEYKNTILGGKQNLYIENSFAGNNLSKFSISLNSEKEKADFYSRSLEELGKYVDYDFTFKKPENLKYLEILISFLPGTKISINKILIDDGKIIEVKSEDIKTFSKNGYILENKKNNLIEIIKSSYFDDIITLKFNKNFSLAQRIILSMKVSRLDLASQSLCKKDNQ